MTYLMCTYQSTNPGHFLRMLEQGPESQSAFTICAGGVSAVMSSSDLDRHTFHQQKDSCHRLNRALPTIAKPIDTQVNNKVEPPELPVDAIYSMKGVQDELVVYPDKLTISP